MFSDIGLGAGNLRFFLDLGLNPSDEIFFVDLPTKYERKELINKLQPYLEKEEWIIDGNYHHTLTQRLKYATDVFFLDIPREECIKGMLERIDIERDDIPWVETREDAEELIAWTEDYENRHKKKEEEMLKENKQVVVHRFNSREEINAYLESIKNNLYKNADKLLNNYNILDLKIFYDLYLNKKTIKTNSTKYNDNLRSNFNNQKNKNKFGYHNILSNNFSVGNDSKFLLSPIKSYYKYTLMINLDTIVYTDEIMHYYNINFDKTKKKTILRPGLIQFLQEMKQIFELILFCNNTLEYIKKALRHFEANEIFFEHFLCNNQLYLDKDGTIKDLDLLGRNLKHIIIIDSNQNMFKSYKDNVIYIRPFYGNVSDDGNVLKELTEILKNIIL
mgnify:CR=1 FL=1